MGDRRASASGRGNKIELTHELRFPHSLGLLYSAFTYYTGFRVNSGEYKLMGLAPYGEPKYVDLILEKLIDLKDDGSFRMDMRYFNYCQGLTMTSKRFDELFGAPPREPESPDPRRSTGTSPPRSSRSPRRSCCGWPRTCTRITKIQNLCLAGGVALNCVGNGRILREGPFENLWIQPAAGDAGGALGVALFIWHQLLGNARTPAGRRTARRARCSARGSSADAIRRSSTRSRRQLPPLRRRGRAVRPRGRPDRGGKVIGWVQGRMEFGPRALGSRSIIGDARSEAMQIGDEPEDQVPRVVPAVRARPSSARPRATGSRCGPGEDSPYMLLVAPVREDKRRRLNGASATRSQGIDKLKVKRSVVPAITHVDYSARVQTVDEERHGRYHKLLSGVREEDRLPGHHQHELQRARRADRLHARARVSLLPRDQHGRPRARGLRAR